MQGLVLRVGGLGFRIYGLGLLVYGLTWVYRIPIQRFIKGIYPYGC